MSVSKQRITDGSFSSFVFLIKEPIQNDFTAYDTHKILYVFKNWSTGELTEIAQPVKAQGISVCTKFSYRHQLTPKKRSVSVITLAEMVVPGDCAPVPPFGVLAVERDPCAKSSRVDSQSLFPSVLIADNHQLLLRLPLLPPPPSEAAPNCTIGDASSSCSSVNIPLATNGSAANDDVCDSCICFF